MYNIIYSLNCFYTSLFNLCLKKGYIIKNEIFRKSISMDVAPGPPATYWRKSEDVGLGVPTWDAECRGSGMNADLIFSMKSEKPSFKFGIL